MRFVVLLCALWLGGCTVVKNELGHPGGELGALYDRYLFEARSQRQITARYLMMIAMTSQVAADFSKTPEEARATAILINAALKRANNLLDVQRGLASCNGTAAQDCAERLESARFAFETNSFELQRSLSRLLRQALSNGRDSDLADALLRLEMRKLLRDVGRAVPVFLSLSASLRDMIYLYGDAVDRACAESSDNSCKDLNALVAELQTGTPAPAFDSEGKPTPVLLALWDEAEQAGEGAGAAWSFNAANIRGALRHVGDACDSLVSRQVVLSDSSAGSDAFKNLENCGDAAFVGTVQLTASPAYKAVYDYTDPATEPALAAVDN